MKAKFNYKLMISIICGLSILFISDKIDFLKKFKIRTKFKHKLMIVVICCLSILFIGNEIYFSNLKNVTTVVMPTSSRVYTFEIKEGKWTTGEIEEVKQGILQSKKDIEVRGGRVVIKDETKARYFKDVTK